jgi:hypothetical protein
MSTTEHHPEESKTTTVEQTNPETIEESQTIATPVANAKPSLSEILDNLLSNHLGEKLSHLEKVHSNLEDNIKASDLIIKALYP